MSYLKEPKKVGVLAFRVFLACELGCVKWDKERGGRVPEKFDTFLAELRKPNHLGFKMKLCNSKARALFQKSLEKHHLYARDPE